MEVGLFSHPCLHAHAPQWTVALQQITSSLPEQDTRSAHRATASDLAQGASQGKHAFAPDGPEPL